MRTRFIVTGLGRCGSNLLKFALKQNPEIHMVGELFNPRVYPEVKQEDGAGRARGYFEDSTSKCTGFKLFEHQARRPPAESVWDYLAGDSGLRIVHLSRKNSFKRNLSLEVANVRGQFLADDVGTDDIEINFAPEQWEKKISLDEKRESKIRKVFQEHPMLHLYYEDLVADWETRTSEIQTFLEVVPVTIEKTLKKQEKKHPRDRCPNYTELVEYFSATPHVWMFN